MKSKALLTAVLLAASNLALAQGGLGYGNAEGTDYTSTDNNRPEVVVQGRTDTFDVEAPRVVVDTEKFKNSNNGQA